jgi:tyrosyl-tRNA synthetase
VFSGKRIEDPAVFRRLATNLGSFSVSAEIVASSHTASALAAARIVPSGAEARRLVQNGGLAINGAIVREATERLPQPIDGRWWEVRIGKKRLAILELEDPGKT